MDFQRSLKRLRKFNERRVNRHTKKKLKQAATLLLTPKRSMIKKPIKPKTLNETAENLLNETPSKDEKDGKVTLTDNEGAVEGKDEDLNHLLDEVEKVLEKTKDGNSMTSGPSVVFAFNPDISFPDTDIGNQLENTSNCPTVNLVTRGRENPGVGPVQSGHLTYAFSITGESNPKRDKKLTMLLLCNLLLFLCRVNQYQETARINHCQSLGNLKPFTMKTMAVRI